nr:zinc finger BED domain-containing protein RICESLEEPER 2-like [Tanacetum cinerariifolium]
MEEEEESSHFESKKRKTTSKVWNEFTKIKLADGRQKAECHYCKSKLYVLASESTTHLGRHLKSCTQRAIFQKQQQRITLQVVDPDSMSQIVTPALVDGSQDKFVHDMVKSMKENFDKYWKECNLLMSVAAILDPRCKMTVAKFTFPRMYSGDELKANIKTVKDALSELYEEYVSEYYSSSEQIGETSIGLTSTNVIIKPSSSGWSEFNEFVKKNESVKPQNQN